MSTIYFSLLVENGYATSYNHCMLCWYLHALCYTEDICFCVYICAILNYAADLWGDGPTKIGSVSHFTLECVILIYLARLFVLYFCKIDHHTDCVRVQSSIFPIPIFNVGRLATVIHDRITLWIRISVWRNF